MIWRNNAAINACGLPPAIHTWRRRVFIVGTTCEDQVSGYFPGDTCCYPKLLSLFRYHHSLTNRRVSLPTSSFYKFIDETWNDLSSHDSRCYCNNERSAYLDYHRVFASDWGSFSAASFIGIIICHYSSSTCDIQRDEEHTGRGQAKVMRKICKSLGQSLWLQTTVLFFQRWRQILLKKLVLALKCEKKNSSTNLQRN